jgi:hypothetical protein
MDLIIYINDEFEDERVLFDLKKEVALLSGDGYHEKIDNQIDGYLKALKDHNIYTKDVKKEQIDNSHNYYKLIFKTT